MNKDDGSVKYEDNEDHLERPRCAVSNVARIKWGKDGEMLGVNKYKILKNLGTGSYGEVFLCLREEEEEATGCCLPCRRRRKVKYALKVIPRKLMVPLEYQILVRVKHPHIVQLLEYVDDPSCAYVFLIFEMLEGGPIASITAKGHLEGDVWSEEKAIELFYQIVNGLQYLHQEGIVHRDIKPENIVFTHDKRTIKIIDFGVSRIIKEGGNDANTKTRGTPFFQAPETLKSCYFPDKASDVWALGVLFYVLLVGRVPFGCGCENRFQLWDDIQEREPEYPMVKGAKDLIKQMLQKDISRRITIPAVSNHYWLEPAAKRRRESLGQNCPLVRSSLGLFTPSGSPSSQVTNGSKFSVAKTPVQQSLQPRGTPNELSSILGSQANIETRILIVDDIHHERTILTRMFDKVTLLADEFQSLTVFEVETGQAAIHTILQANENEQPYHAVLVDLYLSDMDGFSVINELKRLEDELGYDRTPVILMAGQEERPPNFKELLDSSGVQNAILTKPVHTSKVKQILNWLGILARDSVTLDELSRPNHIADEQYLENSLRRYKLSKKPSLLSMSGDNTIEIDDLSRDPV
eukprot:TRINITY_DN12621_c0_g1_i1.p1 TRINITY_DN12621_c0_g1~~TRINITY_DN12621_c0_g1_i1.p1  ORF type:complete len:579 (+),score=103.72 TRINITY_DN12621_c0_g1_i1:379-2115(+)